MSSTISASPDENALDTHGPFVGLSPYQVEDADWFFGRASDSRLITDNLVAYELTLLFGPSGVGKSSLINAGVFKELERLRQTELERGRPPFAVVIHRQWQQGAVEALHEAIDQAVLDQVDADVEPPDPTLPLKARLTAWTSKIGASIYVILDQFEEYFLYHPNSDDPATIELAEAIATLEDDTNFLMTVREDALAKLDRFDGRIPDLFENIYRLEHLDSTAAKSAVTNAVGRYNERHPDQLPVEIEPALVEELVNSVRIGNVVLGRGGVGRLDEDAEGDSVETAQLQLVLAKLWHAGLSNGDRTLRVGLLHQLGGAEAIVRSHLAGALDLLDEPQQAAALEIFSHLVTPSGSKIAHTAGDLASFAGTSPAAMTSILERLSAGDARIMRPVAPTLSRPGAERFEIFHDVLAAPILDWTAGKREDARASEAILQSELDLAAAASKLKLERRRRIIATTAAGLLIGLVAASFLLWRSQAQERRVGESRAIAANALDQLASDPASAAAAAADAFRMSPTPLAERTLREVAAQLPDSRALSGHNDAISDVTFSPDGQTVLTGGIDATARLWDAETGTELAVFEGHTGEIFIVDFSPDGTSFLTASYDMTVRVWPVDGGPETVLDMAVPLSDAAWDPSGSYVAVAGQGENVEVWDANTGEVVESLPHDGAWSVNSLNFVRSEEGDLLVSGTNTGLAQVWNTDGWEPIATIDGLGPINVIRFSGDGSLVFVGSRDWLVAWVWPWRDPPAAETDDGESSSEDPDLPYLSYDNHNSAGVVGVWPSPDGKRVLTMATEDAQLWSLSDVQDDLNDGLVDVGTSIVLEGHQTNISDAAWSPDGRRVVTSALDGRARLWDGNTGALLAEFRGHEGGVFSVAFGPDGQIVTGSSDRTARLWDSQDTVVYGNHDWEVHAVDVDLENNLVILATGGGKIQALEADSGQVVWELTGDEDGLYLGELYDVSLSPDGRHLVTGGSYGDVVVWDVTGPEPIQRASWYVGFALRSVFFDRSGESIGVASIDARVHLWRWNEPTDRLVLVGHRTWSVGAFAPHDDVVATGGGEGSLHLWDATTGVQLHSFDAHLGGINDLKFNHEGTRLITAGDDRTIRVWDVADRSLILTLSGHERPVLAVTVSADGTRILSGDQGGSTAVWDAESGTLLSMQPRHNAGVLDVAALSGDGVVSVSQDRSALGYQCTTCGPIEEVLAMIDDRVKKLPDPADFRVGTIYTTQLAPGTCALEPPAGESFNQLDSRSCDEPHDLEYFANFQVASDEDGLYPGAETITNRITARCEVLAEAYVEGTVPDGYEIVVYSVTEEAWDSGFRGAVCAFLGVDGGTENGSLRGKGG